MIFGMCIESLLIEYLLNGIWLQIKFGEIFWGEVKIDVWNGGGVQGKRYDHTMFSSSNS